MMNLKFWIRREWLWYYVVLVIILTVVILVSVFHTQIVHWLTPATRAIHNLPFGWLVPVGILFIISFPPLFGHEIVAILCGLVWGLWIGFGIVAAGTFLGEVGNFYAFKACCRSRGEKMERTKISYACLAKVVRDGGFKIALIARLSAIPGHFTTAIFSTCGMSIFIFSLAAILSLPKQFMAVFVGVILEESGTGTPSLKSRIISDAVLAITVVITGLAMWYILHEMNKVKPEIIYQRRRARIGKVTAHMASIDTVDDPYQHWDKRVAVLPNSSEVALFAPIPERATEYVQGYQMIYGMQHQPRDEEEAEWDTSSVSAYAGMETLPSDATSPHIGNFPSAASSTSTIYAPVPQPSSSTGLQTPTMRGTFAIAHSQDEDQKPPGAAASAHEGGATTRTKHEQSELSEEDLTPLPYRSALDSSSSQAPSWHPQ
jgi:uncharacterized membrane protein YdjX (TVP38/TMEM64 family)